MKKQMKFLLAGILLLILVVALALMMKGETDSVSSVPSVSSGGGQKVADQLKKDPDTTVSPVVAAEPRAGVRASRDSRGESAVSQAQIDLVTKREEARVRRDEMMKERANTINELGPGNTGEVQ